MRVEDLPPPPAGRSGWPWTIDSTVRRDPSSSEVEFVGPSISIVTPSLQQGDYIEETIRSVLLQGYAHLEYIVIDGGSTDGTVEILRRYEPWLTYWSSEPDRGQTDAINKGFDRATGEMYGFLNSDDLYLPGALHRLAHDSRRDGGSAWHAYPVHDFDESGHGALHVPPYVSAELPRLLKDLGMGPGGAPPHQRLLPWVLGKVHVHQPGVFWRRHHWERVGGMSLQYHYGFDRHFFIRLIAAGFPLIPHGGSPCARFRLHETSKTVTSRWDQENRFRREYFQILEDLEPLLDSRERAIARESRFRERILEVWKLIRSGAGRCRVLSRLASVALDWPGVVRSRFFWGTLARSFVRGKGRAR